MSLEQMTYKLEPAGHDAPAPKRKYTKPDRKLAQAFKKYLASSKQVFTTTSHSRAIDCIRNLERDIKNEQITADELHSLLHKYADHPCIITSAPFFSQTYNLMPQRTFFLDIDIGKPLEGIGCYLNPDKILVVLTGTGRNLGEKSKGTILNYGQAKDDHIGHGNQGLIVNYENTYAMGGNEVLGTVINQAERSSRLLLLRDQTGYLIDYAPKRKMSGVEKENNDAHISGFKEDSKKNYAIYKMLRTKKPLVPKVWDYLQKLKILLEPGKHDYKKAVSAIETLGTNPAKVIRETLDDLFKGSDYDDA